MENTLDRKNLLSSYEKEESDTIEESASLNSESGLLSTVKVYLRVKPFPKKFKLPPEEQNAYTIIDSTTLYTKLPALDTNTSCLKKSKEVDTVCRKFMFTKTFGQETTQLELFEQAVRQQMIDFMAGQNSTIMTYGTTNSGKSYTQHGTATSPGIIPRCLEFVYSNVTSKATPCYKPVNHCDVVSLSPLERAQELQIKTKLLTFASVDKHQYINVYKDMQKLLEKESSIRPSRCIDTYSVWVSFAEIYNEVIYDLLSNTCHKKRTPLKLGTDNHGRAYIKGLKTICVNSGSEAYQVFMTGKYNLRVAATALNATSSRSHCIFTIQLLKYRAENDPNSVKVSTFAFCDLAGSERLKKTLNSGDRLKESQNINTSLLVLGRCLKAIHDGQLKHKLDHVVPFRESKLTRLLQKALSGKETITLIVNINPIPDLYVETQSVLHFSAIAKKIVMEKENVQKKSKSRFSQIIMQSIKTVTDWDAAELSEASERKDSTEDDNIVPDEQIKQVEEQGEDLTNIKNLLSAAHVNDTDYVNELKSQLLVQQEQIKKNKILLDEAKEDCIALTVDIESKERIIWKQIEELYQKQDLIDELSEEIEDINACLHKETYNTEVALDESAKLTMKYEDLEAKYQNKCLELNTMKEEFGSRISKCKSEYEGTIKNLQKKLSIAVEKNNVKSQCLEVHAAKITELQHDLEAVKELHDKINETISKLATCQAEKEKFQNLLRVNNDKLLELEDRLENAEDKETEKDEEIKHLQQEIKKLIQKNDNDGKIMEVKMNSAMKDLMETKKVLCEKEKYIDQLEFRIECNEQNDKISERRQQRAEDTRKAENETLRAQNEELKCNLVAKEREMKAFVKRMKSQSRIDEKK